MFSSASLFIWVPAAMSLGLWVQPWAATTKGTSLAYVAAGNVQLISTRPGLIGVGALDKASPIGTTA